MSVFPLPTTCGSGFCYDLFCADPPIQNDPRLEDVNLQDRVNAFVAFTQDYYTHNAPTGHVMFEMGSDFMYEVRKVSCRWCYRGVSLSAFHSKRRPERERVVQEFGQVDRGRER